MGSSNSIVMGAGVFRLAMTDEPIGDDVVDNILLTQLSAQHLKIAFPFTAVRQLRHMYTHNFAIILYSCIREVAEMARRAVPFRRAVSGNSAAETDVSTSTSVEPLTQEQITRFTNALQMICHLMPGALESGMTPFEMTEYVMHAHEPAAPQHTEAAKNKPSSSRNNSNKKMDVRAGAGATTVAAAAGAGATLSERSTVIGAGATQTKRRTRSTLNFRQLFFHDGNMCNDARPKALFGPLWCQQNEHHQQVKKKGSSSSSAAHPSLALSGQRMTLGEVLCWSLVECCFVPTLTLPQSATAYNVPVFSIIHPEVQFNVLWEAGIACNNPFDKYVPVTLPASLTAGWITPITSTALMRHRREILQTLLFTMSTPLYDTDEDDCAEDLVRPLLSTAMVPRMPTLMASMLNTVLQYSPYGSLPYTSYMVGAEEDLMVACARVMVSLTCHAGVPVVDVPAHGRTLCPTQPAMQSGVSTHTTPSSTSASAKLTAGGEENKPRAGQYIHCGCKLIHDLTMSEVKFVVEKLRHVISVNTYSLSTVLPESQRTLMSTDEFMLLLWKLMDLSPTMLTQLVMSDHLYAYLIPVLRYALQFRISQDAINQSQIGLFILLRMSEVRGFAMQCNKPFRAQTVFPLPHMFTRSTYNNLIVLSMCLIFECKTPSVMRRWRFAAMLVSNVAPYITALCDQASVRLTTQFACACNRLLFNLPAPTSFYPCDHPVPMDETVICLCEALASLLQYQESGSKYVLATLIDFRHLVQRMWDIYEHRSSQDYTLPMPVKLLIKTLQLAVTTALPAVAGLGISTVTKIDMMQPIGTICNVCKDKPIHSDGSECGSATKSNKNAVSKSARESIANAGEVSLSVSHTSLVLPSYAMACAGEVERERSMPSSDSRRDEYIDLPTGTMTNLAPAAVPLKSVIKGPHLADNSAAMSRLSDLTLVGALPAPHAIVVKKIYSGQSMDKWATKMFWISMYMSFPDYSFGDSASLKLIEVASHQQ